MKNLSKRIMTIAASLALVVVVGICMTACGSSKEVTTDTYKTRLMDAGYTVTTIEGTGLQDYVEGNPMGLAATDLEWIIVAMKGQDGSDMVSLIKFTSEDKAKEMETQAAEAAPAEGKVVRQGKILIAGMENAVNIALGK